MTFVFDGVVCEEFFPESAFFRLEKEESRTGLSSKSAGKGDNRGGNRSGFSPAEVAVRLVSIGLVEGVGFLALGESRAGVDCELEGLEGSLLPLRCSGLRGRDGCEVTEGFVGSIRALFSGCV